MNNVDEFLNGGDSDSARHGRAFGAAFHVLAKWSSIILVALVLVAVGQFRQYMASAKDVRNNAIEKWIIANQSEKLLADRFVSECVMGKPISNRDMETKVVGVYECGIAIGARDLVSTVKAADETMGSVVWPLSLIN